MNSGNELPEESGATSQNVAPTRFVLVGINRDITTREGEDFKRQLEERLPKNYRAIVLSNVSSVTLI